MIKFEHTEVVGWHHAIRGMRNPLESWEKSDSHFTRLLFNQGVGRYEPVTMDIPDIGENDLSLMKKLRNGGPDHGKFMRMIIVYVDITAPLYFWKEFDTYKVGTVANSESTMHCIHKSPFIWSDFSLDHLESDAEPAMKITISALNNYRGLYLKAKENGDKNAKKYWWQMIQLLPTSYNQKRTVTLNYEVLRAMYHARKGHKLDEWSVGFVEWCESLPYSELITGAE